jgi:glycine/D-amino acid oxidase-like deaminating enzyme
MDVDRTTRFEETSFWARQLGPYVPSPPLDGEHAVDVAIVGGGFTGLSTARELRASDAGLRVAVLEAAVVGYGASGRNGGFSMKLFGMEPEVTVMRWGEARMIEAHRYLCRAVEHVRQLVATHGLDSDYRHTGFIRVAYTEPQVRRLHKTAALYQRLGIADDMTVLDGDALRAEFATERYRAGLHERESGILNPCKHVRELKRLAVAAGAEVYERTPVVHVVRGAGGVRLVTPGGALTASKLVLATNAYSRVVPGVPELRRKQAPVWTFQVVTAPLGDAGWASLGWRHGQSFEDNRQFIHYFRPTVDGRITMGGGDITGPFGDGMDHDFAPRIWRHLEAHLRWLFPQLRAVAFDYRWGGPVSVNLDLTPEIGFLGDARTIYATGCIGHGVSMTQLNGRLIADLLLDRRTDLTDFWIVNRKAIPWPPEPFGFLAKQAVRGALRAWDAFEERGLARRA